MSEERKQYIQLAYRKLDKNKDGRVTLEDIAGTYDASQHPEVKAGRLTPEQVFKQFMEQWDTQTKDGIVTIEEFMDYYKVRCVQTVYRTYRLQLTRTTISLQ